jgi:hypothetical protein
MQAGPSADGQRSLIRRVIADGDWLPSIISGTQMWICVMTPRPDLIAASSETRSMIMRCCIPDDSLYVIVEQDIQTMPVTKLLRSNQTHAGEHLTVH